MATFFIFSHVITTAKYTNYKPGMQLGDDDSVLMSLQEFLSGGKDLEDVPVTITPDGEPTAEDDSTDSE